MMKFRVVNFLVLLLFCACSHSRYYDRDRESPFAQKNYQGEAASPSHLEPLANPLEYYQQSYLQGQCTVKVSSRDQIGVPCKSHEVRLRFVSKKKRMIEPSLEKNGRFQVEIESDEKVLLEVHSDLYSAEYDQDRLYGQGDFIQLVLSRKK